MQIKSPSTYKELPATQDWSTQRAGSSDIQIPSRVPSPIALWRARSGARKTPLPPAPPRLQSTRTSSARSRPTPSCSPSFRTTPTSLRSCCRAPRRTGRRRSGAMWHSSRRERKSHVLCASLGWIPVLVRAFLYRFFCGVHVLVRFVAEGG